jgi:hypothetical protein
MADVEPTKEPVAAQTHDPEIAEEKTDPYIATESAGPIVLPDGWMYRTRKIGSFVIPWYASPKVQLILVSFVAFLCPGMFNALGGMGGGGKADATLADDMVSLRPQKQQPPTDIRRIVLTTFLLALEYCSLQYLCIFRIYRRFLCQPPGCQDHSCVWWSGLLHLLDFTPCLCPPRSPRFQYFCRCLAGCLRCLPLDGTRNHYGFLPN